MVIRTQKELSSYQALRYLSLQRSSEVDWEYYFFKFKEVNLKNKCIVWFFFSPMVLETMENYSNYSKQFSGDLFYTAYRLQ